MNLFQNNQPENTKPVLKLAAIPEPKQGSWASAIAPKTKPKPKTVSKPVPQPEESKPEEHIPVQEEAQPVESVLEDKPQLKLFNLFNHLLKMNQWKHQPSSVVLLQMLHSRTNCFLNYRSTTTSCVANYSTTS